MQVRTLNKVAMVHPLAVTNCNIDLEGLIVDQNRPIATLAITTLLKTGSEGSVDRLLKQIGNFMTDIADEFKIVVVEAIRSLCLKFPQVRAPAYRHGMWLTSSLVLHQNSSGRSAPLSRAPKVQRVGQGMEGLKCMCEIGTEEVVCLLAEVPLADELPQQRVARGRRV